MPYPLSACSSRNEYVASKTLRSIFAALPALVLASFISVAIAQADEPAKKASPEGRVQPFDASALQQGLERSRDRSTWPAWRRAMEPLQWHNVPGTSLAKCRPPKSIPGNPGTRIGAWNGLAADPLTNRLFTAANGGHADYAGNEVCEIDLSVDQPEWKMLRAPSPAEDILASNGARGVFHDYYRDGRPASTHTYYALQFLPSRNAIFKFGAGSLWGSGNEANWKTDAFSLANRDWHPEGTWPDVVPETRRGVTARPVCIDPRTDQVYVAAPKELRRFDPKRGEYELLSAWPDGSYAFFKRPCAVDTHRGKVVFFGDAYGKRGAGYAYDIATGRLERIRFQGEDAGKILKADYNFAWYDPVARRYLVKTKKGNAVYSVDPQNFSVTGLDTTGGEKVPDAVNGVQSRWQRVPGLGGYAFYPTYRSGIWFLATE